MDVCVVVDYYHKYFFLIDCVMNNFVDVVVAVFFIVVHVLVETSHVNSQSHSMCSSETDIAKAMIVQKGGKVTLQPVAQLRLAVHHIVQNYYGMLSGVLFLFISFSLFFLQESSLPLTP